jgi:hypothetical protein
MNLLKQLLAKLFKNIIALIGYGIALGVVIFLLMPSKMWDDKPVAHSKTNATPVAVKPVSASSSK